MAASQARRLLESGIATAQRPLTTSTVIHHASHAQPRKDELSISRSLGIPIPG